jgi:hypothetical protein
MIDWQKADELSNQFGNLRIHHSHYMLGFLLAVIDNLMKETGNVNDIEFELRNYLSSKGIYL